MHPRRRFVFSSLAFAALESAPAMLLRAAVPGFKVLPAWKPGILEIHQIATNRGNSALLLLPDGTTLMVDAGAIYGTSPYILVIRCLRASIAPASGLDDMQSGVWMPVDLLPSTLSCSRTCMVITLATFRRMDHSRRTGPTALLAFLTWLRSFRFRDSWIVHGRTTPIQRLRRPTSK